MNKHPPPNYPASYVSGDIGDASWENVHALQFPYSYIEINFNEA